MKIKIIDLLNKIANGEEVPKKIRIAGWCYKFEWVKHDENYYDKNADIDLMSCLSMCEDEFNREVEIIEEDKPIEELDIDKIYEFGTNKNMTTREFIQPIEDKINELVKAVNELKKASDK